MKPIDGTKLERIKKETKILIVEKGYHGASIAELARRAKVSDGYLYRHYKNKAELVKDIFESQLKQFHDFILDQLENRKTAKRVVEKIVSFLFELSNAEPYAIPFAHSLVYDFEFDYPESRKNAINEISTLLLNLGKKTNEFAPSTREIDIQLTVLTIPVKFIEYSSKGYHSHKPDNKKEQSLLVNLCMKALQ